MPCERSVGVCHVVRWAAGEAPTGPKPSWPESNWVPWRAVGQRVADAGLAVAGRAAGGDRVPLDVGVVLVDERQARPLRDDRDARLGEHLAEVAGPELEVLDLDLGRGRAVGRLARVGVDRQLAAVVVVLGQVAVGQLAGRVDGRDERVRALGLVAARRRAGRCPCSRTTTTAGRRRWRGSRAGRRPSARRATSAWTRSARRPRRPGRPGRSTWPWR